MVTESMRRYALWLLTVTSCIAGGACDASAGENAAQEAMRRLAVLVYEARESQDYLPLEVLQAKNRAFKPPEPTTEACRNDILLAASRVTNAWLERLSPEIVLAQSRAKAALAQAQLRESKYDTGPAFDAVIVQMAVARSMHELSGSAAQKNEFAIAVAHYESARSRCVTPSRRKAEIEDELLQNAEVTRLLSTQVPLLAAVRAQVSIPEFVASKREMERKIQAAKARAPDSVELEAKVRQATDPGDSKALERSREVLATAATKASQR